MKPEEQSDTPRSDAFDEIPIAVRDAAFLIGNWMQENGHERWELFDLCSRNHATELNEAKSILKDVVEHGPYDVPYASDRRFVLMACEDARKRAKQFISR